MKTKPKGFIALMSAVVISAVLLTVAVTASLSGALERSSVLNAELKERSFSAADACVDFAFLQITNNSAYTGLSLVTLNSLDLCRVLVSGTNPKIIKVQATSSDTAVTNLLISYSTTTSSVLSWQETPVF